MISPFLLDKSSIMERLGGDEEIFSMMVDMFLEDVDNNCSALLAALQGGDSAVLQREAHTIKGLLATFSDEAGATVAYSLEQQARLGSAENGESLVQALNQRMHEVAGVLRDGSVG
jgi:histidine phosphotransfer protein HptB